MPEVSSYPAGTPSWVDLSTPDVEGAARFYQGLFGWEAVELGPPEQTGGYRMLQLRGRNVAGLGPMPAPGMPSVWTMYVAVDDADITATACPLSLSFRRSSNPMPPAFATSSADTSTGNKSSCGSTPVLIVMTRQPFFLNVSMRN